MALVKYKFRPGIDKESTSYSNEGGWFDGDKVRFRKGNVEKMGGWVKNSANSFNGTCRKIAVHKDKDLNSYNFLGTHTNLYLQEGDAFNDITPVRAITGAGDATFAASNGSSTITVTETGHGAGVDDTVTFYAAASLGGNITADVLNQSYRILTVPNANTFTISAKDTSGNAVTANSSDSSNGGSSTVAKFHLVAGLDEFVQGTGWGASTWGSGTWGSSSPLSFAGQLRLWSMDSFGDEMLFAPRGGDLFIWKPSFTTTDGGTASANTGRFAQLASDQAGASNCPTKVLSILVSDVDRHVLAFGANPIGSTDIDPLFVRWSDAESAVDWTPTATNSSGGVKLSSGNEIIGVVPTRQETLIMTDSSVISMRFVGAPFYFSFNEIASGIGMVSPNAGVSVGDTVYWMDERAFYIAKGSVQKLTCSVLEHVYGNLNLAQRFKIFAAANPEFNEIIWFYPSASSNEVDRYVSYNYQENVWSVGTTTDNFTRTAWNPAPTYTYPIATGKLDTSDTNYLYDHEYGGLADGSTYTSYIESADFDLNPDGDRLMFISRLVPDLQFLDSSVSSDAVSFTIKGRKYPLESLSTLQSSSVTASSTFVPTRARTRQTVLRIENTAGDFRWRLGDLRLDLRSDGRK